ISDICLLPTILYARQGVHWVDSVEGVRREYLHGQRNSGLLGGAAVENLTACGILEYIRSDCR
ncbi:MAG: hypothetical protein PHC94_10850, partial [Methylobacter sp.]|nr:hypothetical protein [Methylobacter sp.]